jgi:8-oxo-dGTP pyrophosphatase MutT (NUDIX family)
MNVRTKVVVSVINSGEALLSKIYDPKRDVPIYIPVGGGVEFRESLYAAARRELYEEISVISDDLIFCSFSENFFHFDGKPEHEIVYHYITRIDDTTRANLADHGTESDGTLFPIKWYSRSELEKIRDAVVPKAIYPEILSAL